MTHAQRDIPQHGSAAPVGPPPARELRAAYTWCRRINAHHGRTFYLATKLLPAHARPAAHALYGFARAADEIVDNPAPHSDPAAELAALETALFRALDGQHTRDPVLTAVADTASRYRIERVHFEAFLRSMRMDLRVAEYPTRAALSEYTHGSAAAIGLQMLPVLGTVVPREEAAREAAALGEAFQLTNFIRDVGEDLGRGRLYLPSGELAAHGVDRQRLLWALRTGERDARIRSAIAEQVGHARAMYRRAEPGVAKLRPESRPCIRTALRLYEAILDEIVAADFDVLRVRAVVPRVRRLALAGRAVLREYTASRRT
ncbi:phytoene synthase [Haloechinothrix alba]|uniref:Phytoene synthase n=1 Tax=Haloechinothrix alba TaxID=664784 RepID=A0A238X3H1_9PSEU|nr:phytoene/squalene synthase family protein [Haloechinothrix alba]SNR53477.1 phytoene synthase [Haloechinothrix alba]